MRGRLRREASALGEFGDVAVVTAVGVVGIYAATLGATTVVHGTPRAPDASVLFGLVGAYALAVGGWCGRGERGWRSTVVASASVVLGFLGAVALAAAVDPAGTGSEAAPAFLAVLCAMLFGAALVLALVGYRLGGALAA